MNLMVTLRQLWNQHAVGRWILGGLVVATHFLWGAVGPMYVLLSDKTLPDHYDFTDAYLLSIDEYSTNHTKCEPEMVFDSLRRADFMRIVDRIRHYPDVSNATVNLFSSYL